MNENETPLEGATSPPDAGEKMEQTLAAIDAAVDAGSQATEDAAAEAETAIESLAGAGSAQAAELAETMATNEQPSEVSGLPVPVPTPPRQENGARKQTLTDRLTESREFDPDATNDDRIMAALAYASQLIFPLGFVLPIILLISETSKKRPFQRYHAVQSLAVGTIIWILALIYAMSWVTVGWIMLLCLCLLLPVGIALWLLPLYYAMLAYNGKRFRIRGLTQFLEDQRWL
ncbi:MAG TPA: DUF4870 domain-containing protein [Anaerolineae bacterium]|nr:DUF4870 domain-containing protein [Anaerolineae bacterium]